MVGRLPGQREGVTGTVRLMEGYVDGQVLSPKTSRVIVTTPTLVHFPGRRSTSRRPLAPDSRLPRRRPVCRSGRRMSHAPLSPVALYVRRRRSDRVR